MILTIEKISLCNCSFSLKGRKLSEVNDFFSSRRKKSLSLYLVSRSKSVFEKNRKKILNGEEDLKEEGKVV